MQGDELPGGGRFELRSVSLSAEERKVRVVELLVDELLHHVLDDWRPSGHLVGLLIDPFLPLDLPDFAAIPVDHHVAAQKGQIRDHVLILGWDLRVLDQLGEVLLGNACNSTQIARKCTYSGCHF